MSDNILQQVEAAAEVTKNVPAGYVKILMSTRGKYGAPSSMHIRNFSIEEALELGSMTQDDIPIKVPALLQKTIFEKEVDINKFYEPEVAEFCIHFYEAFYSKYLKDINYQVTDADREWMKNEVFHGKESAEYQDWLRGIDTGKIKTTFEIDLSRIKYYSVPETAKKHIKYTNRDFNCKFQYPRFGDTALLQRALKEKFRVQDAQMGPLYEIYKRKQEAESRLRRGENVAIEQIPYLNEDDMKAVRQYEIEKTAFIFTQMKGLQLCEFMGEDVSGKSLSERVEIAKDPRIDFSTYQTVSEHFSKLEIGPVPKIQIVNPVTGILQEIDHPFRPLDLLAAIRHYKSDNANIEFV